MSYVLLIGVIVWSKAIFFLILVEVPKSTHNSQRSSCAFHNVLPIFPRRWWKRAMPKLRTLVTLWNGWLWLVWGSEAKFCGWRNRWRTQPKIQNKKSRSLLIGSNYSIILFTHSTHTRNMFHIQLYTPNGNISSIFWYQYHQIKSECCQELISLLSTELCLGNQQDNSVIWVPNLVHFLSTQ